jgi:hypothetical protein
MDASMNENPPALPPAPDPGKSCLIKGLGGLLVVALVLGGVWWWYNRPIQPVQLSPAERQTVEAKVEAMQMPIEPTYEKGSKEIVFTERELNGLLNENTSLGKTVKFELGADVILARVETDLDPDLPVVGGRRLKARARILVGDTAGQPSLIIDDLTVWGISLPNAWLAGLKGRDLLGEILGGANGKIAGVEEFRVEPGQLTIRLAE